MKTVIFDIDGTLADCTHRRQFIACKPKNWAAFESGQSADGVLTRTRDTLMDFVKAGVKIILCSGRNDHTKTQTIEWLNRHEIPFDDIYMRKSKDTRQDYIVKEELLDQLIADGYDDIIMVFDDRQQVVDMWRRRGLIVHQVAEGDF